MKEVILISWSNKRNSKWITKFNSSKTMLVIWKGNLKLRWKLTGNLCIIFKGRSRKETVCTFSWSKSKLLSNSLKSHLQETAFYRLFRKYRRIFHDFNILGFFKLRKVYSKENKYQTNQNLKIIVQNLVYQKFINLIKIASWIIFSSSSTLFRKQLNSFIKIESHLIVYQDKTGSCLAHRKSQHRTKRKIINLKSQKNKRKMGLV